MAHDSLLAGHQMDKGDHQADGGAAGHFPKCHGEDVRHIYELNITRNCSVGKRTEDYFESLGAKGLPYDQGLRVISEKQIKEKYRHWV